MSQFFRVISNMFQFRLGGTDHNGIELGILFGKLRGIGIDLGDDPIGIDVVFRLVEEQLTVLGGFPLVLLFQVLYKVTALPR